MRYGRLSAPHRSSFYHHSLGFVSQRLGATLGLGKALLDPATQHIDPIRRPGALSGFRTRHAVICHSRIDLNRVGLNVLVAAEINPMRLHGGYIEGGE